MVGADVFIISHFVRPRKERNRILQIRYSFRVPLRETCSNFSIPRREQSSLLARVLTSFAPASLPADRQGIESYRFGIVFASRSAKHAQTFQFPAASKAVCSLGFSLRSQYS